MKRMVSILISVAFGLFGGVSAVSPASAAPVEVANWSYLRSADPVTNSVDVLAGEEGFAQFSAIIGPEWSGWGHPKKKKYTFLTSDFTVSDGSVDFPYSVWYAWEGTSSTDEECYKSALFTTKFVLPKKTCVDTVAYAAIVLVSDVAEDTSMWGDQDEASFTGNGRVITTDDGLSFESFLYAEVAETASISVDTEFVSEIAVETEMCIDESLIDNGDEASRAFAVEFDGSTIAETATALAPWVDWQGNPESESVLLEGEEPLQNLTVHAGGLVTTPDVGVVTATVSMDIRFGGSSILEPCTQAYAGPLDTSATGDSPAASDTTMNLPTDFAWVDGGTPEMWADGFGGIFAIERTEDPETADESSRVTHLAPSGDNDDFAGDGVLDIAFDDGMGAGSMTRWGTGGNKWLALSWWNYEAMTFRTGAMTSSTTDTVTVGLTELEAACNRPNAEVDNVVAISAPTNSPLIQIDCYYRASKKRPFVRVSTLAFVDMTENDALVPLAGFPSDDMAVADNVFSDISVNPNATGRESAVFVYSQSSKVKKVGTEYRATSIEPDGTVNFVDFETAPFGSRDIQALDLVPGATDGTWVGVVNQSYWNKRGPVLNDHMVTITAGDTITVGDLVDIGYSGEAEMSESTMVSLGSDSEFGQIVFARSWFDNAAIGDVNLLTWDVANGDVSTGEEVSTVDPTHGYEPLLWSSPGAGDPSFFWITSETEYQVVTWAVP